MTEETSDNQEAAPGLEILDLSQHQPKPSVASVAVFRPQGRLKSDPSEVWVLPTGNSEEQQDKGVGQL